MGQLRAAWQVALSLWRIHLDEVLRRLGRGTEGSAGRRGHPSTHGDRLRAQPRAPGRAGAAELRWRQEPMAVAHTAHSEERGNQAGARRAFRSALSGLQLEL